MSEIDKAGEIFDPEIHSTKSDGTPSITKSGYFRKRRRDSKGPQEPRPASAAGKAEADRQASYVKSVAGVLQPFAAVWSMVDPVDGYCASELVGPWAGVFGELAMEYPQVAAAIEKAAVVGPLTGVVGLGALTLAQFGHNHGLIPENIARMVGARSRTEIEKILAQRGAQMAAEAEEWRRFAEEERRRAEAKAAEDESDDDVVQADGGEHGYAAAV
ncbi:MAG: hypothetical protein HOV73_01875 [Streptomyces sp.]|nr:hypothetical protein [Streptomyces sp.]